MCLYIYMHTEIAYPIPRY